MTINRKEVRQLYEQLVCSEKLYFRIVDTEKEEEFAEQYLRRINVDEENALIVTARI